MVMINWDGVIIGLIFLVFGLIGINVKRDSEGKFGYSEIGIFYSSYGLVLCGLCLIIWSIFL